MAEVSMELFNKVSNDLDELKKNFHEHEKTFSEFAGEAKERHNALLEYMKRQDATTSMVTENHDRIIKLETERDASRRNTKIWLTICTVIATALPVLIKVFWG